MGMSKQMQIVMETVLSNSSREDRERFKKIIEDDEATMAANEADDEASKANVMSFSRDYNKRVIEGRLEDRLSMLSSDYQARIGRMHPELLAAVNICSLKIDQLREAVLLLASKLDSSAASVPGLDNDFVDQTKSKLK